MKIEELIQQKIARLREDKEKRNYNGCWILLSPGPGVDGRGAPGLCSAVALKLCQVAFGEREVKAITYVLDGAKEEDFKIMGLSYPLEKNIP